MMSAPQNNIISLSSLLHLPAKKRLDFLINHPSPLKLVRETRTPDLLVIIREVGAESALELVEMMHPQQIQELLDFEIWQQDQINPRALGHYLSLLFEANVETAIQQIYHLDIELLGVVFKTVSTIYDLSAGEEPYDYPDLYSISPDNRFLVCFDQDEDKRGLAQSLHQFLEQLYGRDLPFALRLLESLRFELVSHLEEESLRMRDARLLDFGILPREERLEYFASLYPSDIKKYLGASVKQVHVPHDNIFPVPVAVNKSDRDFLFLLTALEHASEQQRENFSMALMHAVTNMHATLSADFGDSEAINETARYVKFLINLGIFQICDGNISAATTILDQYPARLLLRLGRGVLVSVRKRLRSCIGDAHLFGRDFCYVDSPLREVARALSLPEPCYYEGLLSPKKLTVRHFTNLNELQATIEAVNEMVFRSLVMGQHGLAITTAELEGRGHLSHANMLARVFANTSLDRADRLQEITASEATQLFANVASKEMFENNADVVMQSLVEKIVVASGGEPQTIEMRCTNFKNAVLTQIAQNWQLSFS